MRGEEPFMERDMRTLENRSGANRELNAAIVAEKHPGLRLAGHAMDVEQAAKRAVDLIRPAISLHVRRSLGFIVKNWISEVDGHAKGPAFVLASFSAWSNISAKFWTA